MHMRLIVGYTFHKCLTLLKNISRQCEIFIKNLLFNGKIIIFAIK